ncbi:MAG TPA: hypothetical protein VES38_06660 [Methylotenera sp.]|nr:hypothetical protein [Methylotenera sp.]
MKFTLLALLLLSLNVAAREYNAEEGKYKSRFGNEYEYDLSKPSDQIRYETDTRAQMRDELDVDPRREIERDLGQHGGGKVKRRY